MTTYVALLRGINVGGHKRVPMAELRSALAAAGLGDVRTYLQSGNAAFTSSSRSPERLAATVRDAIAREIGVDCAVLVRSGAELAGVVARNPWPERTGSPTKLNVAFLSQTPVASAAPARVSDQEEVVIDGKHAYIWYGDGAGRSKLSLAPLGVTATVRNWTTVVALAELTAG